MLIRSVRPPSHTMRRMLAARQRLLYIANGGDSDGVGRKVAFMLNDAQVFGPWSTSWTVSCLAWRRNRHTEGERREGRPRAKA